MAKLISHDGSKWDVEALDVNFVGPDVLAIKKKPLGKLDNDL
jgi:hypothetical protein